MLTSISERLQEMQELTAQLGRQEKFYKKYGLHAHEIRKILLTPKGRSVHEYPRIVYHSTVTLHDGSEHTFDMNVKEFLDGEKGKNEAT